MNQPTLFPHHKHARHRVHDNSREAWRSIDTDERKKAIVELLKEQGPLTDREIKDRLGYEEMNAVRPRVTELTKANVLFETGRKKCSTTKKRVRVNGVRGVHGRMM